VEGAAGGIKGPAPCTALLTSPAKGSAVSASDGTACGAQCAADAPAVGAGAGCRRAALARLCGERTSCRSVRCTQGATTEHAHAKKADLMDGPLRAGPQDQVVRSVHTGAEVQCSVVHARVCSLTQTKSLTRSSPQSQRYSLHAHTHAHADAHMHACACTYACKYAHACTHAHGRARTHAATCKAHATTHTHSCTYIGVAAPRPQRPSRPEASIGQQGPGSAGLHQLCHPSGTARTARGWGSVNPRQRWSAVAAASPRDAPLLAGHRAKVW
jgi:hypothetical protein